MTETPATPNYDEKVTVAYLPFPLANRITWPEPTLADTEFPTLRDLADRRLAGAYHTQAREHILEVLGDLLSGEPIAAPEVQDDVPDPSKWTRADLIRLNSVLQEARSTGQMLLEITSGSLTARQVTALLVRGQRLVDYVDRLEGRGPL